MENFQLVQPSRLLRPYVKQYWFLAIDNAERSSQRYVPSGCAAVSYTHLLADAGVDVLVMDVTNAVRYWDEWETLFTTMQKMKAEGNKVPQFCFWAFNGPVISVVQDLYDKVYKLSLIHI